MLRFRDVSLRSKLYGLVIFSTLGLTAVLGLSLWVLYQYRINGPLYDRISRRAAALSELEPSAFDTGRAYATLIELSAATDPSEARRLREEFSAMEKNFLDREEHWTRELREGPLKAALTREVFPGGHAF